jgi:uncharacterized protein
MRIIRNPLLPLLAISMLAAAQARAQKPEPGDCSKPTHRIVKDIGRLVPVRDGIRLSVDIYRPAEEGRYPVVFAHVPYGNGSADWWGPARGRWFAARGYVYAAADFRGRYDSEGTFDIFDHRHKTDGYDLVEWLAKQPWSNGRVGMTGPSYLGWAQWWTASEAPPSLAAIAPEVAPPDPFHNGPYQDGILVSWAMDWGAGMMAGRTNQTIDQGSLHGWANTRAEDFMHLPYIDLPRVKGVSNAPWFPTWIRENLATADYWRRIAYQGEANYAKMTVPSLGFTGWFDGNFPGTPMNYQGMKRHGATPEARRPQMVVGPWTHIINSRKLLRFDYGPDAVIDLNGVICRWFDHHLKGIDNGADRDPPVRLFVMGSNRWIAADDWPLPGTRFTRYYLHSGGRANTLSGDGTLSEDRPGVEPPDTYAYDPADPTPDSFDKAADGSTLPIRKVGSIEGAVDTRASAGRDDVLVYQTAPLEDDLEIIGPVEATLFAATSARDTDWMLRLVDVHPDGYAALLADGVLRARCRDPEHAGRYNPDRLSVIEPDRVTEYTIRFWRGVGNVFQKGHRIRVEVSSCYYPYYLRNLNTGADNVGLETTWVTARQRIHHDERHPSSVLLPVIPAR